MAVISLWAALRKPYQKVLIVAPTLSQTKNLFSYIDLFLSANPFINEMVTVRTSSPFLQRVFSNGSEINGFTLGSTSKRKGDSVRGQGADVIIIDEGSLVSDEDWLAINPIIEGSLYRPDTIAIVAGTPKLPTGRFYEIFNNPALADVWFRIHIPISQNPDFKDRVDRIRASCPNDIEWMMEYEAEFPSAGTTVFRQDDVRAAMEDYVYSLDNNIGVCAIGVDWDKHQAGVNIAVVQYIPTSNQFRLLWREEIPRSEVVLTEGVRRIIELNRTIRNVAYIAVDRGYGEMQVEMLKLEGVRDPESGLDRKVIGFSFSQHVEIPDPVTGERRKVRLKDAVISLMGTLLESGRFKYSVWDSEFRRQLSAFHVVSMNASGPKYSDTDEHIIDAVGLALWALREYSPIFSQLRIPEGPPILISIENTRRQVISPGLPPPLTIRDIVQQVPEETIKRSYTGVNRRGF